MVATAAILLALPAAAAAQVPPGAQPQAEVSASEAEGSLATAEAALEPAQPAAGPVADPSAALNDLALAAPSLRQPDRARARGILARPTEGPADRYGDGFPKTAPVASAASDRFCVLYVSADGFADAPDLSDGDGDGVPDYVEQVLSIAEHSYSTEVTPGALGWAPPKPDLDGCGADPSKRTDIYLKQLGNAGLFGYESPDPGQGPVRSKYGYLVIDDDYAAVEYGLADPLDAARVTIAHELNHLLQQGYDSFQDAWMFEATAVWAEEYVEPAIDDYVNYVDAFASRPGVPITERAGAKGLKIYGAAVWNHWLSGPGGGFGSDGIRRAWEVSPEADPADFAIGAYDRAMHEAGGRGFSREFAEFAAASAEWRAAPDLFPDAAAYPDVQRKQAIEPGAGREMRLDHTAYRMFDVRDTGSAPLTLRAEAEQGVRAGFSLVARDGDPVSGRTVIKSRFLDRGGKARLSLGAPGEYERITVVAVNADGRVKGYAGSDWNYRKDGQRLSVALDH